MTDASHVALAFLNELAADRQRDCVGPLARYLAKYPGHEELVAEEYLRARAPAAEPGDDSEESDERIGRYRLVRELGRGGQASVWLAEDERLGRQVALKIVPRMPGAGDLSPRFRREARATASLEHPNLCVLYEAGVDDACAWIAMQYVEGETLGDWLERRESTPPTAEDVKVALGWLEKVARALHAAHAAGVVHRDIKPANLIVQEGGEPVVLDFGVAALDEEGPQLTQTGTTLGTPAYMSPEQLRGEPVRPGVDVWSLGATLYEVCTGRRPFDGPTREALVQQVLYKEPTDPRRLSPAISNDLAAVLETALSKEPEGRYRTALALAEDLRRVQANEPTAARPIGRAVRLKRWAQRNPIVAGLSAAVLVVGSVGLATTLSKNRELATTNQSLVESNDKLRAKTDEASRNADTARREAAAKSAALAEYERMADTRRLDNARREEQALFPIHPDLVPELETWQRKYANLFDRLASHEQALELLRASAPPYSEADRLRDHADAIRRAERIREAIQYMYPAARQPYEQQIAEIEASLSEQLSWNFGDDVDKQFRHDALARLVDELRRVHGPRGGPDRRRSPTARALAARRFGDGR